MSAVKKLQKGTLNRNLISQALSKAWIEKKDLSDFVSRRVKQRVLSELEADKTLAGLTPQRAVKYVRTTFNRILSEIESPIAAISSEDTVVKICLQTSQELVSKNITKQKKRVPYHYDEEFLATMPSVATTNVLNAFRKDLELPVAERKYKTEAQIKNIFIKTLKNLHIDFLKLHSAVMRGAGREVLGSAEDAQNIEFGISSHQRMESGIHREQLIGLLAETQIEMKSESDKRRITMLMSVVLGMNLKDAAKAAGFLVRDAEIEMAQAVQLIKKYDLLVEAFEDFSDITENEYDQSLTSAANHVAEIVEQPKAPAKKPEPLFSFKPSGNKYNGTVTYFKGEEAVVLNCINQPSISAAKETLTKLMKGAE